MQHWDNMRVLAIAAITANGRTGRDQGQTSLAWTSPEDTKFYRQTTTEAGTMILGSTTFRTIGKALPGRRMIVMTSHPEDITVPDVEATSEDPDSLLKRLGSEGCEVVAICGGSKIYQTFLEHNLIDDFYVTVEPLLFASGIPLIGGAVRRKLKLLDQHMLNENSMLLHYAVEK
jgi:dihydrofolate reductase